MKSKPIYFIRRATNGRRFHEWKCPVCNRILGQLLLTKRYSPDQNIKRYCPDCGWIEK